MTLKHKSPSARKRDNLRMTLFNNNKKEAECLCEKLILEDQIEHLQQQLLQKSKIISKLERDVSLVNPKPKLSIMTVSHQNIPPTSNHQAYPDEPTHGITNLPVLTNRRTNLTTSTSYTNFPQPCQVCNLNQCQFDMAHQLSFAISEAVDKAFKEVNCNGLLEKAIDELNCKLKPPDDD